MKEVRWYLSIGYARAAHSGTLEFDDDATDEEIEEAVQDTINSYIDYGWELEG